MQAQFPNAMMSALLVKGRAVRLVARPYPMADWSETSDAAQPFEGENVVFSFYRSVDGRAALVVRHGETIAARLIVDAELGKQYFVQDERNEVVRMDAVKGWDWDREYAQLSESNPSTKSIGNFSACLARSSDDGVAGRHEL